VGADWGPHRGKGGEGIPVQPDPAGVEIEFIGNLPFPNWDQLPPLPIYLGKLGLEGEVDWGFVQI
jgi:hypothetical protein